MLRMLVGVKREDPERRMVDTVVDNTLCLDGSCFPPGCNRHLIQDVLKGKEEGSRQDTLADLGGNS